MDYLNPVILLPTLALLCALVYFVPGRYRWVVLLAASYAFYFYISHWALLILILLTSINYFLGIALEKVQQTKSRALLIIGILINVGFLVFFKYGGGLFQPGADSTSVTHRILLPLGMSFFTLQHIAYLVDVKKGVIPAERHPGIFATFIAFFPKIASGPVERGKKLLPQLHQLRRVNSNEVILGLRQIVFGLFKKMVVADRLALVVNQVFDNAGSYNGLIVLFSILFLAFQIYMDFSGYTDIAIGAARLFGIELTVNFKRPYLATDVVDFWNRWHLSFSTWLRDYIFYPTRRFLLRRTGDTQFLAMVLPALFTMLLSGAWHGAGWNFIAWGLFHALFYILSLYVRDLRKKHPPKATALLRGVDVAVNFVVISVGWVIFRLDTFAQIKTILRSIFWGDFITYPFRSTPFEFDLQVGLVLILLVIVWEVFQELTRGRFDLDRLPAAVRWIGYALILLGITVLGVFDYADNPFIYFEF